MASDTINRLMRPANTLANVACNSGFHGTSSGETECPGAQCEPGEDGREDGEPCALCEAPADEPHGMIYIGDHAARRR